MSEINIHDLYRQERLRWLREEAPRRSLRDVIAESVPYWIILVALVLYGLSAPHTASVFDKLAPGWGWMAPIGIIHWIAVYGGALGVHYPHWDVGGWRRSGLPDKDARQKALAEVKGYLSAGRSSGVRSLSAGNGQVGHTNGQPANSAKNTLRRYLDEHSEAEQLSVNQLRDRLQSEGIRIGRTSVAEVLKERRQQVSA